NAEIAILSEIAVAGGDQGGDAARAAKAEYGGDGGQACHPFIAADPGDDPTLDRAVAVANGLGRDFEDLGHDVDDPRRPRSRGEALGDWMFRASRLRLDDVAQRSDPALLADQQLPACTAP